MGQMINEPSSWKTLGHDVVVAIVVSAVVFVGVLQFCVCGCCCDC